MAFSLLHALGIALFGLAWFITDHFKPWANFHAEALALWSLALLAWAQLAQPAAWARQAPRWAVGLLLLALVPWLQWALGIGAYAGDAWVGSLFLCALAVAVSLGYSWGLAPPAMDKLRTAFFSAWRCSSFRLAGSMALYLAYRRSSAPRRVQNSVTRGRASL